jgi:hypothetical protein
MLYMTVGKKEREREREREREETVLAGATQWRDSCLSLSASHGSRSQ